MDWITNLLNSNNRTLHSAGVDAAEFMGCINRGDSMGAWAALLRFHIHASNADADDNLTMGVLAINGLVKLKLTACDV